MPAQKLDKHSLKILNMEPSGIVSNNSQQQLMSSDSDSQVEIKNNRTINNSDIQNVTGLRDIPFRQWLTVIILCYVNLINYMDRFTIAGVLTDIQKHFDNLSDDKAGLLQTAFVLSYMLFAPLFGYLGDRYSRKLIMAAGVFLWSLTTLLGSFMNGYSGFIVFRALVGIGEASYSTIAPTIISDMFVKDIRSKMLALFYFAIPVGSGLGYIVGSETAKLAGNWQWALRVTPIMGAVAVILILLVMQDPSRGASEGSEHLATTAWLEDIKDLSKNPSFMLSTLGFTCVAFVAGALSWWGPKFIALGIKLQDTVGEVTSENELSFLFGLITMLAGVAGLTLGVMLSQGLKSRWPRCDPVICACGLFFSAPLLTASTFAVTKNTALTYTLLFFGQVALNLNWSIVADILLYVVIPTRRSTAEAFQILMSHALGDAGSPYLIGVVSEALKIAFHSQLSSNGLNEYNDNTNLNMTNIPEFSLKSKNEDHIQFTSLQYALLLTTFIEVLGGLFFLLTAVYILRDKMRVEQIVSATNKRNSDATLPENVAEVTENSTKKTSVSESSDISHM